MIDDENDNFFLFGNGGGGGGSCVVFEDDDQVTTTTTPPTTTEIIEKEDLDISSLLPSNDMALALQKKLFFEHFRKHLPAFIGYKITKTHVSVADRAKAKAGDEEALKRVWNYSLEILDIHEDSVKLSSDQTNILDTEGIRWTFKYQGKVYDNVHLNTVTQIMAKIGLNEKVLKTKNHDPSKRVTDNHNITLYYFFESNGNDIPFREWVKLSQTEFNKLYVDKPRETKTNNAARRSKNTISKINEGVDQFLSKKQDPIVVIESTFEENVQPTTTTSNNKKRKYVAPPSTQSVKKARPSLMSQLETIFHSLEQFKNDLINSI